MHVVSPLRWFRRKAVSRLRQRGHRCPLSMEYLEDRLVLSTTWVEQGPGPILGAFNAVVPAQNNPEVGAVAGLATDPSNADVIYAATVNGGVWKTTNGTSLNPTWTPLTDLALPFLSTNSIAISPVNSNIVFVGTGSTSSDASQGVAGFGIARTTDGGATWTFAGPINRRIRSVVATPLDGGNVVLACTLTGNGGVYRSDDGGGSYTRISGSAGSGLPGLGVGALAEDPGDPSRIYAAIPGGGSSGGVYKSEDGGLTWTQVDSGLTGFSDAIRAKLTVSNNGTEDVVYAMFIGPNGGLESVSRSSDLGTSWQVMASPSPDIYPGLQGSVHGAIAADPANPDVVYITGDRQAGPFPNSLGAMSFSGITFRGTSTADGTVTWESVDWNGANGTSPHADSRSEVFDAQGNLLRSDDGGMYKLVNPSNPTTRHWVSINGNIHDTEIHSVAFDPVSKAVFDGTQDNGTDVQNTQNKTTFQEFLGGDGGVVGVDGNESAHPGTSIRYTSFQFFGRFNRSTWDVHNNFLGATTIGLNIVAGPGAGLTLRQFDPNIQFYQPFVINSLDPTRMMIGTAQFYESLNQGDSLTDLNGFNGFFVGNDLYGQPMVYGGSIGKLHNPDVFYGGIGPQIEFREHLGDPLSVLSGYHGGIVSTITMNPRDYRNIYVVDTNSQVWVTFDKGVTFSNITLNLGTLSPQIDTLVLLSPDTNPADNVLVAGGIGGVWALSNPTATPSTTWAQLGTNMPHVIVQDLHFDARTNTLIAGTLGRGAWTLFNPTNPGGPTVGPSGKPFNGISNTIPNLTGQYLADLEQVMAHEEDGGGGDMSIAQHGSSGNSGSTAGSQVTTSTGHPQASHAQVVSSVFGHGSQHKGDDLGSFFDSPF